MKARRLKAKLCRVNGMINIFRMIAGIGCIIAPFAAIPFLFSSPLLTDLPMEGWWASLFVLSFTVIMLIFIVPLIAGVLLLTKVFAGIASAKELRFNGRMSYEYLKRNGLLEAAAAEYFGKDRFVCRLRYKGSKPHRYSHRKNVLTPNFVFIMSDNIVLTYDEIKKARFLRVETIRKGKSNFSDTFALQMADGTEIALFSSRFSPALFDPTREMIRRQGIVTEIANRITAKNPDCVISRINEKTKIVSADGFTTYYR